MNDVIAKYENNGYKIEINLDRLVARCDRIAPRARLGYKNEYNYRFASLERLNEYVAGWINRVLANKEAREKAKAERKARVAEEANKVEIGDIYVASWGWEQTNVDFYEVVAKPSPKTVIIREIACRTKEGSEISHGMADSVYPVRGAYIGEEMKKRISAYGSIKINDCAYARPTDENRSHYRSWYA